MADKERQRGGEPITFSEKITYRLAFCVEGESVIADWATEEDLARAGFVPRDSKEWLYIQDEETLRKIGQENERLTLAVSRAAKCAEGCGACKSSLKDALATPRAEGESSS